VSVQSESTGWFDQIDLDPAGTWLRMGTRQLGERPWLLVDEHRNDELAMKEDLCAHRHREVFAAQPDADVASAEVLRLVSSALADEGIAATPNPALHALDAAGRSTQEDLCLMRRDVGPSNGWRA